MTDSNTTQPSDQAAPAVPESIDALKQQMDEYLNGWKRAKADLINFQRDTEKRQREIAVYAHAGAVLEFIPFLESFTVALGHMPEDIRANEWGRGVEQLLKQATELLRRLGVERIATVGTTFSVDLHEAVGRRAVEGSPPGTIIEDVQAGYTMHGKVLRPAKVIVVEEAATQQQ